MVFFHWFRFTLLCFTLLAVKNINCNENGENDEKDENNEKEIITNNNLYDESYSGFSFIPLETQTRRLNSKITTTIKENEKKKKDNNNYKKNKKNKEKKKIYKENEIEFNIFNANTNEEIIKNEEKKKLITTRNDINEEEYIHLEEEKENEDKEKLKDIKHYEKTKKKQKHLRRSLPEYYVDDSDYDDFDDDDYDYDYDSDIITPRVYQHHHHHHKKHYCLDDGSKKKKCPNDYCKYYDYYRRKDEKYCPCYCNKEYQKDEKKKGYKFITESSAYYSTKPIKVQIKEKGESKEIILDGKKYYYEEYDEPKVKEHHEHHEHHEHSKKHKKN